jgi:cytochrome c
MSGATMRGRRAVAALALLAAIGVPGAASAQGDAAKGEKRFEECATCHSLKRAENGVGPTLNGVFDRKAAAEPDFRYSPAMRRSGIVWTAKTLDDFLADPQQVVTGNRMPYSGMTDAGDRADLIAYLQRATK